MEHDNDNAVARQRTSTNHVEHDNDDAVDRQRQRTSTSSAPRRECSEGVLVDVLRSSAVTQQEVD